MALISSSDELRNTDFNCMGLAIAMYERNSLDPTRLSVKRVHDQLDVVYVLQQYLSLNYTVITREYIGSKSVFPFTRTC